MLRGLFVVLAASLVVSASAAGAGSTFASASTVVKAAINAKLKATILVDVRGRTLYLFTEDKGMRTPQCFGNLPHPGAECAKEWPQLLGPATPGKGVRGSLLGTVKRPDGTVQVTYAKYPLYYFGGGHGDGPADTKPGDVRGQGLFDSWYVVSPAGKPVKKR